MPTAKKRLKINAWLIGGATILGWAFFSRRLGAVEQKKLDTFLQISDGFSQIFFKRDPDAPDNVIMNGEILPFSSILKLGADKKLKRAELVFFDDMNFLELPSKDGNLVFAPNPEIIKDLLKRSSDLNKQGVLTDFRVVLKAPSFSDRDDQKERDRKKDLRLDLARSFVTVSQDQTIILPVILDGQDIYVQAELDVATADLSNNSAQIFTDRKREFILFSKRDFLESLSLNFYKNVLVNVVSKTRDVEFANNFVKDLKAMGLVVGVQEISQ